MFFALLFLCIMVGMFSYFCGFLCQLSLSLIPFSFTLIFQSLSHFQPSPSPIYLWLSRAH